MRKSKSILLERYRYYIILALVVIAAFLFGIIVGSSLQTDEKESKTVYAEETSPHELLHIVDIADLGEYEITAYCACEECCGKTDGITATGTKATAGRTIAVDPDIIPYGTEVIIGGHSYIAEDCGGAIKGNRIDIYFNSHDEALEYGRQTADVFLVSE